MEDSLFANFLGIFLIATYYLVELLTASCTVPYEPKPIKVGMLFDDRRVYLTRNCLFRFIFL